MNIDRRHCRRAIPTLCAMLAMLVMSMCGLSAPAALGADAAVVSEL